MAIARNAMEEGPGAARVLAGAGGRVLPSFNEARDRSVDGGNTPCKKKWAHSGNLNRVLREVDRIRVDKKCCIPKDNADNQIQITAHSTALPK